jgi:hypothetical protein
LIYGHFSGDCSTAMTARQRNKRPPDLIRNGHIPPEHRENLLEQWGDAVKLRFLR